MPPRIAPGSDGPRGGGGGRGGGRGGRGAPGGGRGRGTPPQRGGRGVAGAGRGGLTVGLPSIGSHVSTIGVKRPGFGTAGRPYSVITNNLIVEIPEKIIRHYDIAITPELAPRLNTLLIKKLQCEVAREIFSSKAVYDGRKNLFTSYDLRLGPSNAREFDVTLNSGSETRPAKVYKVKVTKVAEINPELLQRFIQGQQSHDNEVLTAIMAMNIVIRMEPNSKYPFNVRSFFTPEGKADIGLGISLWRGYFQSIRPGIGKMLINIDISTGMMYKEGRLLDNVLQFIGKDHPRFLSPAKGFPDRERVRLRNHLKTLKIITTYTDGKRPQKQRPIKDLSREGADRTMFDLKGTPTSVAQYFRSMNIRLDFPDILCVEVGRGNMIPMELCVIPPGQLMKKQVPPEKTADVVRFASKRPEDRFESIRKGIRLLEYGQSEYVRDFGMHVDTTKGLLDVQARVLYPPKLQYGRDSKQPDVTPRDGSWNMIDKRFFKPSVISRWAVVNFAGRQFHDGNASDLIRGFIQGCRSVGITVSDQNPIFRSANGQGRIGEQLRNIGSQVVQAKKLPPELLVVILPEGGNDIYTAVKHFGDITMGVVTQCLKAIKCRNAKPQYWANVCLKVNVKMGGINLIPDPHEVATLTDPNNPTIVMGADVIHPAPGALDRPSFTAVVGNVDSHTAKYVASTEVQTSKQEMIDDLQKMCREILQMYRTYRSEVEKQKSPPARLIFYRDGVSEGQFKQVLDDELPRIQAACKELKIQPKITLVVVGKRHHVRFLPRPGTHTDKSGNCPAGLVVDTEICHPTEFDFFLQSHGGLIGTSRPAHYTVLYDENNFTPDSMQSLSFALCHVYARATRSVSIPAPVYYADIVCSRAKNHYDPEGKLSLSESGTQLTADSGTLDMFRKEYKQLHENQARRMYFM